MAARTTSDPDWPDSRAAVGMLQDLVFLAPTWDEHGMDEHLTQLTTVTRAAREPATTLTLYQNNGDWQLPASQLWESSRQTTAPRVAVRSGQSCWDIVDTSLVPPAIRLYGYYSPQPGHSYFGDSADVCRDLRLLLLWGWSAPQRAQHGSLAPDPSADRHYALRLQHKHTLAPPTEAGIALWRRLRQLFAAADD